MQERLEDIFSEHYIRNVVLCPLVDISLLLACHFDPCFRIRQLVGSFFGIQI